MGWVGLPWIIHDTLHGSGAIPLTHDTVRVVSPQGGGGQRSHPTPCLCCLVLPLVLSPERGTPPVWASLVSGGVFSSRLRVLLGGQASTDTVSIPSLYHGTIRTRAWGLACGSRPVRTSVPIAATVRMAHTAHGHGSVGCVSHPHIAASCHNVARGFPCPMSYASSSVGAQQRDRPSATHGLSRSCEKENPHKS